MCFVLEVVYTANLSASQTENLLSALGVVPVQILGALRGFHPLGLLTLVSSMFVHVDLIHIGGNMIYLFAFGGIVEDALGRSKYLVLYLASGIAAGLFQVYLASLSGPPEIYIPAVGASGAISGVLAASLVFFPRSRVVSVVGYFIIPVRTVWFIGFWFVLQLLFSYFGTNPGVAYGAHIGGFAAGLVMAGIGRLVMGPRRVEET